MLYGLVLVVHILLSLFLIAIVLLQGGRGGLGEALGGAAAQSLFGGGANTVMSKLTAAVAGLFMVTCLSLAFLSTSRGERSVIDRLPMTEKGLPEALLPAPHSAEPPASPSNAPVTSEHTAPESTEAPASGSATATTTP